MNLSLLTKSTLAIMVYAASTSVMAGVFIASANQFAVKTTEKECTFPLNAEDSEITSFDCFPEGLLPWSEKMDGVYYAGFINAQGDPIIPFEYEETAEFAEGLARVKKMANMALSIAIIRSSFLLFIQISIRIFLKG